MQHLVLHLCLDFPCSWNRPHVMAGYMLLCGKCHYYLLIFLNCCSWAPQFVTDNLTQMKKWTIQENQDLSVVDHQLFFTISNKRFGVISIATQWLRLHCILFPLRLHWPEAQRTLFRPSYAFEEHCPFLWCVLQSRCLPTCSLWQISSTTDIA